MMFGRGIRVKRKWILSDRPETFGVDMVDGSDKWISGTIHVRFQQIG